MTRTLKQIAPIAVCIVLAGCGDSGTDDAGAVPPDRAAPPASTAVVEVVARGLSFDAPATMPSGWTTLRFINASPMTHFAVLERLPAGKSIADQQTRIAPVFQQGMDLINAGRADDAAAKFGELPGWFADIEFVGGPGLVSAGMQTDVTLEIEPGTYLLECYVKTNGVFHSFNPDPATYGMVHQIEAVPSDSERAEPTATIDVEISSERGIVVRGEPTIGPQTVRVRFADQSIHEHFLGHDVHVARIPAGTTLQELAGWMSWAEPHGLETPAPVTFLGGTNEMPAGSIAYFTVALTPGDYAWVAEVPDADRKGMLRPFAVAAPAR